MKSGVLTELLPFFLVYYILIGIISLLQLGPDGLDGVSGHACCQHDVLVLETGADHHDSG